MDFSDMQSQFQAVPQAFQFVYEPQMLSDPGQRLYNERNKNLLEGAISFWEASPEGQNLNQSFKAATAQMSSKITKIFAFGLPNLPNVTKIEGTNAQVKFEDLDATQRLPYIPHAALISLKRTLKGLTDAVVEVELHSVEYKPATERFLRSRHLNVHASNNSPALLDELANRVNEQTVVFAPRTDKYFKMYIKSKAKEWPGAVVWNPTIAEGLDAEMWCLGPPERWCSVYDMVTKAYYEVLCAEEGHLGSYEVCMKKSNQVSGAIAGSAGRPEQGFA